MLWDLAISVVCRRAISGDRCFHSCADPDLTSLVCEQRVATNPSRQLHIVGQGIFVDMKFLWLDSYCENIIHEIIIATLCVHANQVASVHKTLIHKLFRYYIAMVHPQIFSTAKISHPMVL